ncbi:hypothetical protein C8R42DRAFT_438232 [Lentinula raphanica]|nr:hypothetical protein C8R42DRAFT_438232 [Lentinula raphanica]
MTRSITRALAILLLAGTISSGVLAAPTPSSMSSGPTLNGAHSDQVPELSKSCPYSSGGANSVPTHQRRGIRRFFCCPMPRKGNPENDGNVVANPGNTHDSVLVDWEDQADAPGASSASGHDFDRARDRDARSLVYNIGQTSPLELGKGRNADISKIEVWIDDLEACRTCEFISANARKEAQALFDELNPKLTELRQAREERARPNCQGQSYFPCRSDKCCLIVLYIKYVHGPRWSTHS